MRRSLVRISPCFSVAYNHGTLLSLLGDREESRRQRIFVELGRQLGLDSKLVPKPLLSPLIYLSEMTSGILSTSRYCAHSRGKGRVFIGTWILPGLRTRLTTGRLRDRIWMYASSCWTGLQETILVHYAPQQTHNGRCEFRRLLGCAATWSDSKTQDECQGACREESSGTWLYVRGY